MPSPSVTLIRFWDFTDKEREEARHLSPLQRCSLENELAVLTEAISNYTIMKYEEILNTPDFWRMQGKCELLRSILQEDDIAKNNIAVLTEGGQHGGNIK